ncbi:MAG: DEAD/DEAH box helicase [Acidobacteriota bacterium]
MSKSNPRGELETEFSAFDLCPAIQKGLASAGFLTPRPIQAATISQALRGRDILGLAQTGTGKTAAFALPILERLLADRSPNGPRALIVAPTRELASQIAKEIAMLARYSSVRTTTVFGGVPAQPQIRALRKGADILVACPGRLLDLFRQGEVHLDRIEVLVLDEADHMFDMGFLPDVRRIIGAVPRSRQTMLFSATMPTEIRGLADSVLRNPHAVDLGHSKPIDLVKHALCAVDQRDKFDALERVFNDDEFTSAIVFTRTKYRAKRLAQQLDRCGHSAVALQGNMSQPQRVRAMDGFRARRFRILVATDIAARGIDVEKVSHVINYDMPNTADAYTHRIGRTGRSERTGTAISFVTPEDREILRAVEKVMGNAIPHWAPHSPGTLGSAPGPRRAEARQPKVLDSSPALRARKSRKGQAASFPRGRHAAYSRKRSGANSKAEKGQAPSLGSFSH